MAEHTPAQLAQFAEMIGITPDTHRHLCRQYCIGCGEIQPDIFINGTVCCSDYTDFEIDPKKLPALDTPAGDDVYLAPFLRWLQVNDWNTDLVARYVGAEGGEAFAADCTTKQYRTEMHKADTATLALLRACQSARVPEIVAIFGEGE